MPIGMEKLRSLDPVLSWASRIRDEPSRITRFETVRRPLVPPIKSFLNKMKYGDPVIIVSGLPRSGTSMAMKMLEAGGSKIVQDGIREADVDNPKGYYEFERVKDLDKGGDNSWVSEHRGQTVKIISFLLRHLPHDNRYKIIFMRRDIDEILASQNKMLDHRSEESKTEDERMKDLYANHLVQVFSMMRFRENFECLEISYNDTIADPRASAEKINAFLGNPFEIADMVGIVDKSLYRNRRT